MRPEFLKGPAPEDGAAADTAGEDRGADRAQARRRVFLPREFSDLGGEDQVLRVLRGLVREGRLVCLGYGVYGRAVTSQLSGKPILYSPNGFADQFLGAIERGLNIGIRHGAAFGGQQNLGERDVCARFEPVDRITTADFLALEWRLWWRR